MADFNTIGQQFIEHYYNVFDKNREVSFSHPVFYLALILPQRYN